MTKNGFCCKFAAACGPGLRFLSANWKFSCFWVGRQRFGKCDFEFGVSSCLCKSQLHGETIQGLASTPSRKILVDSKNIQWDRLSFHNFFTKIPAQSNGCFEVLVYYWFIYIYVNIYVNIYLNKTQYHIHICSIWNLYHIIYYPSVQSETRCWASGPTKRRRPPSTQRNCFYSRRKDWTKIFN